MAPSAVWKHFKKSSDRRSAKCVICNKDLTYCGSTSSLIHHLTNVHNELVNVKKSVGEKPCSSRIEESEESVDDPMVNKEDTFQKKNTGIAKAEEDGQLPKLFQKASAFKAGGARAEECDDSLLYMIAVDNLPLQTPEKRGLRRYSKSLQPLYKPPTQKTLTKKMEEKYIFLKERMGERLRYKSHITLTCDLWTETRTTRTFLGLTAHFLKGTSMESVMIGARQVTDRKSADNLREHLLNICKEWKIKPDQVNAIVTDHGANVVAAAKAAFGHSKHYTCFAHGINLVAQSAIGLYTKNTTEPELEDLEGCDDEDDDQDIDNVEVYMPNELAQIIRKLKKVVSFFRRSEVASNELHDLQRKEGNTQPLRLIQEVRTRWNSLFEMIDRFLKLSELVDQTLYKVTREKSSKSKPPTPVTVDEVDTLRDVRDVLAPLWHATVQMSAEKAVTLSKIIPTIRMMKSAISKTMVADPIAFNLKSKILDEMDTRFGNLQKAKRLGLATIIDPRFKKLHFDQEEERLFISELMLQLGEKVKAKMTTSREAENALRGNRSKESDNPSSSPQGRSTESCGSSFNLWDDHERLVAEQNRLFDAGEDLFDGIPHEVKMYVNRPVIELSKNPFEEFQILEKLYPHVCEVAKEILPIVATSVPSERLFSRAGQILTKLRNRLSGSHLDQLLFLQSVEESMWFQK